MTALFVSKMAEQPRVEPFHVDALYLDVENDFMAIDGWRSSHIS